MGSSFLSKAPLIPFVIRSANTHKAVIIAIAPAICPNVMFSIFYRPLY